MKSFPQGEASRMFFVYTKDFGLIRLQGQGIRKQISKLRFHLEDFSIVRFDLVKGRELWRPVTVEKISRLSSNIKTVGAITSLVLRLCDLEESNDPFFLDLKAGLMLLQEKNIDVATLEAVLVLRLLSHLGYVGAESLKSFISPPLNEEVLAPARQKLSFIIPMINETLKQTSL